MSFFKDTYIPIQSDYDNIDMDHKFITIHKSNLKHYLNKYMCKNEIELEDVLWDNYGLTIKIV